MTSSPVATTNSSAAVVTISRVTVIMPGLTDDCGAGA
jgi:hypothetical protein